MIMSIPDASLKAPFSDERCGARAFRALAVLAVLGTCGLARADEPPGRGAASPARHRNGYDQLPWQRGEASAAGARSAELVAVLRRAPREVRRWVGPVAADLSTVTPLGGAFHLHEIFDRDGHRVGFFSGDGAREDEWVWYRGSDELRLKDEDGDGIPDRRTREEHSGELTLRITESVRRGGRWRIASIQDLRECGGRGIKTTTFLAGHRRRVTWRSCITS